MIYVLNYGLGLTTAQANALNSFVALAQTPAGQHLAKDGSGNFVNTPDTGGAATITTQDEGVTLSTTVTTLNFVGAGVTATGAGATTTITIPGGSGLTVGTTTIASGTTTRILYDNAGVLGEYTITGTGTVVAMQTNPTLSGLTMTDATNIVLNTTTGTKIGTATTQKLSFFNSTPIVQPTGDVITALQNLGLGASLTIAASTITSGAALTKADDTNVTLTLGGSPATALLAASSLTLGWTGTLSGTRGGTGVNNGASTITIGGSVTYSGAFTTGITVTGNTTVTLPTSGTLYGTATGSITSAQLLNSVSDETGTGVLVFGTAPTFTTSITAPLVIGGSGTTGTQLTLKTTTGNGTTDALVIVGGNNGATTFATFSNNVANFGTSAVLTTGTIEVGAASDTTISRSAVGEISVEGVPVITTTNTKTLTNKRVTPRTGTTTSSATPTINTDNVDYYSLTAQAANITSFTTNLGGAPTDGQTLWISIVGTGSFTITWGAKFESSTVTLPTTLTTTRQDIGFVYNAVSTNWRCVALA